ncbi:hypothetical protein BV25DRAFT_1991548 [Artomyces pyxidatus]|uniref:Uncharacterized protein n=1 Tax=Artomyces pyxidatus TaxID=48021 RepID=A0ACB8T0I8_9AGAM|nr:hypothetical protein BV25DRAFT_1991548 [Artomyces pyxidatus]
MTRMTTFFEKKPAFAKVSDSSDDLFLNRRPRTPRLSMPGNPSRKSSEEKKGSSLAKMVSGNDRSPPQKCMTVEEKRGSGLAMMQTLPSLRNGNSSSASQEPSRPSSPSPRLLQRRPSTGRRKSSLFTAMRYLGNPFRSAEASGDTPSATTSTAENPFDREHISEEVTLGSVNACTPRVTSPIAPFSGLSVQAEVVQHQSDYAQHRQAARDAAAERPRSREHLEEGGLFFASRSRNPSRTDVAETATLGSEGTKTPRKDVTTDYLNVNIPHVSISVSEFTSPTAEST